jgi:hypothetical protein
MVDSRKGFNCNAKNVIIKDPEAPLLYSRQALNAFTIFCGALFGSILLAINVTKTKNHSKAVWVVIFGVVFTALQIYILRRFASQSSSSWAIVGGFIAAGLLDSFFWKRYIGYSTFYRARPIWIPLIIAIVVFGLIIAVIILGRQAG